MKKIFLFMLMAVMSLTATAQNFKSKAIVVYKTDGTRDTTLLMRKASIASSGFYGKENPVDDDYVKLDFTFAEDNYITCTCTLTRDGKNAPYQSYNIILSTEHINTVPAEYSGTINGEQIYYLDKKQFFKPDYTERRYGAGQTVLRFYPASVKQYFAPEPGRQFYARAYYILDDNSFFSSEIELRAPRTVALVSDYYYSDYTHADADIVYKADFDKIFADHAGQLGTATDYTKQLLRQYLAQALQGVDLKTMAAKTEDCDDGVLYIIDEVPATVIEQALQLISDDSKKSYYLQAMPSNVYNDYTSSAYFGTSQASFQTITADEKWGIPSNQYLAANPTGTVTKPRVAFELPHLMQPGKTYDVTLTLAPNTENDADTTVTCFYVTLANAVDTKRAPSINDGQRFGTDSTISEKPVFVAQPYELKVMTMQFTADNLADKLCLQLDHAVSFVTMRNRSKYSQQFRIVGIEVKPHEE